MKKNSEIRQESLSLMKGNWGISVGVTLVFLLIVYAVSAVAGTIGAFCGGPTCGDTNGTPIGIQLFSMAATILFVYPMTFSFVMMFLRFVRNEQKLSVGGLFGAFSAPYYGKSVGVYLLINIFTFLWALLLIVPGIIKALSYSLAPYILADNPNLTANQAINESMQMMKGHKMDLFLIGLGYLGFAVLSVLALGIPLLWLYPYYQSVLAKFYEEVKANYNPAAC